MTRHSVPLEWYDAIDEEAVLDYPERLRGYHTDSIAREARHATWIGQMNDGFWDVYIDGFQ